MAWIGELEVGAEVVLDLTPEDLVQVVDQRVVIRLLYKRGRQCRIAIDAPQHVHLEVTPPDSVTLAPERACKPVFPR